MLLLVSVALETMGFLRRDGRFTWAAQVTLVVGTTATLFAFVAGNFAEIWAARDGIPQDPMESHELLATITSWTFVFLTAGRLFLGVGTNRRWMAVYLVAAIAACVLLGITGHQGAMLVYHHGAGVHTPGLPALATHEDLTILLQKQDPDALFYSNKMHHIFGWMVLILSTMLLIDMVSPRWGERVRRFAPLLLLAGGVYLMIFSDQDAWPLYQVRPFRPWTDKEVLMHKTYAILMLLFGLRGLWHYWKEQRNRRRKRADPDLTRATAEEGRQLHARMMAIFSLIGGGLLFTHVHSNAPYANVAAGVYIHHTVMGFIALCIGAVKLAEDALLQRRDRGPLKRERRLKHGLVLVDEDLADDLQFDHSPLNPGLTNSGSINSGSINSGLINSGANGSAHGVSMETVRVGRSAPSGRLRRFLGWAYPVLMLIESIFLINYNEGLPWFLGYGDLALSAPHRGLIAPLGRDRAEFVFDPATQRIDLYVLNQAGDGEHPIRTLSAQANVKVGSDTTTVDLVAEGGKTGGATAHFVATAPFLRGVGLFQLQALVRPLGQPVTEPALVADFEPWIDTRLTAPDSLAPYVCPMHPAVGADRSARCNLCGMNLVPRRPSRPAGQLADDSFEMGLTLYDQSNNKVETPEAGQPVRMEFAPRHANGQPVMELDLVHTKQLHLIVVSQDLSFYDHVHPDPLPDGKLRLEYAFPQAGQYLLFADCTPTGDRNQVFRLPVSVSGSAPVPVPLLPTPSEARTFGNYRVALTITPNPPLVASSQPGVHGETQLIFTLSQDGKPLSDIEPFLGAGGHCILISQDTRLYLHSHPLEMEPIQPEGTHYGPSIAFHTHFPRKGLYKIWGQFQHKGKPVTVDFVVEVP